MARAFIGGGTSSLGLHQNSRVNAAWVRGIDRDRALIKTALKQNIRLPHIRYPGGDPGGFFRLAVTALHSRADIEHLLSVIAQSVQA